MRERWGYGVVMVICLLGFGVVFAAGPGNELGALGRSLGISSPERLRDPADVKPGGTYAFLQHQPGKPDEPVAWEPCREIHYEINLDGAPGDADDAVDSVQKAIAEVSSVTGLVFAYDGTTDRRPQWRRQFVPIGEREPVLISWATEDEVEQLEGDVAGIGGAVAIEVDGGEWLRYVTGAVSLDSDDLRDSEPRVRYAILLHELGHLVGLGHVDSPRELMHDTVGRRGYAKGDLNGLVRLGQGRCR